MSAWVPGLTLAGAGLVLLGLGVVGSLTVRLALLTGLGAVAAGALAPGLGIAGAVAALAATVAVLAAVDTALAAPVGALRVTRSGEGTARLGRPAQVVVSVTNPARRPLRAVVRDAWPPSLAATPGTRRVQVPAGGSASVTTTLVPAARGMRRADPVAVRSLGPMGLAGRQRRHDAPWSLTVLPAFSSRRFLPERLERLRQLDGSVLAPVRGQGSEFDSLRSYVLGDDTRSIDWRASARRDSLVVRTWRPERDRRVLLVLDTGRTSAARVGDAPRLEAALEAALLLGALASRAGDRVDLLAVDRTVRASVSPAAGESVLARLTAAMASLQPALTETDAALLVSEVTRRTRQRALVVVFTALEPAALEEGLLPVLGQLTRRHQVLIAAVDDPEERALAAGRGDATAVYAAAAAARIAAEREAVSAEMRRRGALVTHADPDRFAPAVSDVYLALKAAGRL